jgi:hypothetical protein
MSEVNAETIISAFVALRDKKTEIARQRDAEIATSLKVKAVLHLGN